LEGPTFHARNLGSTPTRCPPSQFSPSKSRHTDQTIVVVNLPTMASQENPPFPPPTGTESGARSRASSNASAGGRARAGSNASVGRSRASTTSTGRLRSGSLRFLESSPGSGFWMATGESAAKAPTLGEIRSGSYTKDGWHEEGQLERRGSTAHQIVGLQQRRLSRINSGLTRTTTSRSLASPTVAEAPEENEYFPSRQTESPTTQRPISKQEIPEEPLTEKPVAEVTEATPSSSSISPSTDQPTVPQIEHNGIMATDHTTHETDDMGTYPNGYRFPPKHNWKESTFIGLKAFWKFTCTPIGFLIVIYGLNVVAWGAMIFFVLLKAAPAMCHPSCDDINSPRKKWIEVDSQVLNGLFCVTGFGLIPWRFRDLYFLMQYRMMGKIDGLRKLAGINKSWFRLPGSQDLEEHFGPPPDPKAKPLPEGEHPPEYPPPPPYTEEEVEEMYDNPAIPLPIYSAPPPPLTGNRAPPTKIWKLDLIIWLYISNTLFQGALCGFMWGWNRFDRPNWGVGLFITLGCFVGIFAGVIVFKEGKRVKLIEGIPITDADRMKMLMMDEEARAGPVNGAEKVPQN
jgi:hypothetical protein